jgi:multiple sugar transport system substrate-binding protein
MHAIDRSRLATLVAVPAALSLVFSGVALAQDDAMAPDESVIGTVVFWNGYGADGDEITTFRNEVLPAFQEMYPNVEIETQEIPYDDLRQKLITGIAGGVLPDVLRSDIIWVPEFADQGVLLALDEEMADFDELAAEVFPGPLSTNKWGDHYYGLPLDTNTRIIFTNDAVLEAAGITDVPATVEDFEAMLATVAETMGEGVYGYAEGGTGAWSVLPWIWTMGGAVTDDALTTASGYLNGEGTVAAVTMLKDWLDKGWLSPSILGGGTNTSDQFGNGQTATVLEGPWMPGIFNNQFPELGFSFTPVPAGPAGSQSVVGGEDIVVFNTTENKEAALAFVRHMLSEDSQLAMGKVGQMPVLSSLVGHADLPDYYPTFMEQLETGNARTPVPAWPSIDEAISNAVLKALRGDMEVQAAMDEAAEIVDGLLAQ